MTAADADDRELRGALGKAIRLRRTELDLSRSELAREADVSYTYVSEIENGTKQASSKTVWRIARALGLEPHELMALAAQWESRPPAPPTPATGQTPSVMSAGALAAGRLAVSSAPDGPDGPPPPHRSRWFHAARPAAGSSSNESASAAGSATPEFVDVLDRIAAALDGVPDERAELALMLSLDERRTRRIVREELDRRSRPDS